QLEAIVRQLNATPGAAETTKAVDHSQTRDRERVLSHLSTILGRSFEETVLAYDALQAGGNSNSGLLSIIYWLGQLAIEESQGAGDRRVLFSPTLQERVGHHIHGECWAEDVKQFLRQHGLWQRPLHIISANLHSVVNSVFAPAALQQLEQPIEAIAQELNRSDDTSAAARILTYAQAHGLSELVDQAGTNINVQIFDTLKFDLDQLAPELGVDRQRLKAEQPVLLVMDYPFGEQAFELMDELLKPLEVEGEALKLNVASISVMGKAGTLVGHKGDLLIPTAHIFEGTADNYPLANDLSLSDFQECGLPVYEGAFVTVLGTSLQNADVLAYFQSSSWNVIGLEMEGAHLQKAIQAAAQIRKSIAERVTVRYAYYASDNPLLTGTTLASGSLGQVGVKPTYLITVKFLQKILGTATAAHPLSLAALEVNSQLDTRSVMSLGS
ncbi:MAG: hypothetical protein AAGF24_11075, partial [Cyanobacteria bacterium P01_H01_bin.121]